MSGIVKPPVGAQLNLGHPLARGLVGCWLMNEGSGIYVNDYSGQGNHGTISGIADPPTSTSGWNAGPHGGAMAFDGGDDYVSIPGTIVDLSKDCSIGVWVNVTDKVWTLNPRFISLIDGDSDNFQLGMRANSEINVRVFNTTRTTSETIVLGESVFIMWTQLSCVQTFYINGVSFPTRFSGIAANATFSALGSGYESSPPHTHSLDGLIYSAAIYNRALSAEEIAYLFAFPYCMFEDVNYQPWMRKHVSAQDYYRHLLAGGSA